MSSNELLEIMILDGRFVIERFQGVAEGFKELGFPHIDLVQMQERIYTRSSGT